MQSNSLRDLKLYSYWRSSASWRVRIALALKGLPYEYIPIDLVKDGGYQRKDDYVKINPMKLVPALVVGDKILVESMAICEFLEEASPEKSLIPKDPFKRADMRAICEMVNAGIQPLVNLRVRQKLSSLGQDEVQWNKEFIENGFEALEKFLQGKHGKFCLGDEVTLADVFLVPQAESSGRWKVDMSKFPTISAIVKECNQLSEFQKAAPAAQPDAEK